MLVQICITFLLFQYSASASWDARSSYYQCKHVHARLHRCSRTISTKLSSTEVVKERPLTIQPDKETQTPTRPILQPVKFSLQPTLLKLHEEQQRSSRTLEHSLSQPRQSVSLIHKVAANLYIKQQMLSFLVCCQVLANENITKNINVETNSHHLNQHQHQNQQPTPKLASKGPERQRSYAKHIT
ncbi:hypothetical protein M758_UG282000 [Ceratodon purpureus]|nr:hypothetical protein M758_UG282000 [Ceratodon purpureus]